MEPDVAEFVSALAGGSGARLMVEARSDPAGPTTQALVAAAQQTGGRVVCILSSPDHLQPSLEFVGSNSSPIEFTVGDAFALLSNDYKGADFVLLDCRLRDEERVFRAAQAAVAEACGGLVVANNAFDCENLRGSGGARVDLLPIGGGLRVWRVPRRVVRMRSQWVVRVDELTGEEHVYRITPPSPRRKWVKA